MSQPAAAPSGDARSRLPPTFQTLPQGICDDILANTNLVVRDPWKKGLNIRHGMIIDPDGKKCGHNFWHACPLACEAINDGVPPQSLLDDPVLGPQARDVMLARNKTIILDGRLDYALSWLEEQEREASRGVNLIRDMTILCPLQHADEWIEGSDTQFPDWMEGGKGYGEWKALVDWIAGHMNLPKLTLTIDDGAMYEQYLLMQAYEDSLVQWGVPQAYRTIVKPLKEAGMKEKGLKKLNCYWAAFHELEAECEKYVMGEDYVNEGKIPQEKRDPFFPEGRPDGDEGNQGMNLK
ncbi:hypothetical protein HK405_008828 [Cladochytrium tenue]|nr:hypothetical protein HK405_008828 [Cladochytrium tenue]